MKKMIAVLLAMLMLVIALGGCGKNEIPDMTEDEMKAIGEYAAFTLMKYDANHRSRLVDLSKYNNKVEASENEEESALEESAEESSTESGTLESNPITEGIQEEDLPGIEVMNEIFELPENVNISYSGLFLCSKYPVEGDGLIAVTADENKQILVIQLQIENLSEQDQMIDIFGKNLKYIVEVNGNVESSCLTTLLPDDFSTMRGSIEKHAHVNLVLLASISSDIADIENLKIKLKDDLNVYTIKLK